MVIKNIGCLKFGVNCGPLMMPFHVVDYKRSNCGVDQEAVDQKKCILLFVY